MSCELKGYWGLGSVKWTWQVLGLSQQTEPSVRQGKQNKTKQKSDGFRSTEAFASSWEQLSMVSKRWETTVGWVSGRDTDSNLSWVQLIFWMFPMLWLTQSSGMGFNCLGQVSCPGPSWFLEDLSNPILHYSVQEDLSQSGTLLHSPFNQQKIQIFQGLLWPFVSGHAFSAFDICIVLSQMTAFGRRKEKIVCFKHSLQPCSMLQQLHSLFIYREICWFKEHSNFRLFHLKKKIHTFWCRVLIQRTTYFCLKRGWFGWSLFTTENPDLHLQFVSFLFH